MAGNIDNNMFFKLTGKIKNTENLNKIDFSTSDYKNIFMAAKETSGESTVSTNDFMNETKNYSKFGSEEFLNDMETMEELADAINEIGLLDGNDGLSYSDLSKLNELSYTNAPQTRSRTDAGLNVPFENRISSAQTARAERAANSTNVQAVDASSLGNKELSELRSERTNEIRNLNDARHKARDYEKNNSEIVSAQNNVNNIQSELDEAIAEESENSESEEVKGLKEQLDSVNESLESQQEVADEIQTDVDEADEAISEHETAVSEAEEGVSTAEEGVSEAEESVSKAQEGVNNQQAALDACVAAEPQQGSFTKQDENGETVPDKEAYSKAHSQWLSQKSAAEQALAEAQKALDAAEEAKERAEQALEEAQEALTNAQDELAEAQDKLAELNEQLVAAQDELTAFEEEKSELETQIAEALTKENPDSKVSELKEQLENAKNELESVKQKAKGETEADIAQYEQNVSNYDGIIRTKEAEEQAKKKEVSKDEDGLMSFYKDNDKLISEKGITTDKRYVNVEKWDANKSDNNDCLSRAISNNYDLEALGIKPGSKEYKILEQAVMDANKSIYGENANRTRIQDGQQHSTVLYTGDKLNLPDIGSIKGLEDTIVTAAKNQGKAYATTDSETTYTNTQDPTKTKVETIHNPDGTTYKRTTTTHLRDGSVSVTKEGDNTSSTKQYDKDGKLIKTTETSYSSYTDNTADPTKTKTVKITDKNGNTVTEETVKHLASGKKNIITEDSNGNKTVKEYGRDGKLNQTTETSYSSYTDNTADPTKTKTVKITDKNGNTVTEETVNHIASGSKTITTKDKIGNSITVNYDKNGKVVQESHNTKFINPIYGMSGTELYNSDAPRDLIDKKNITYTYDENGNISSVSMYNADFSSRKTRIDIDSKIGNSQQNGTGDCWALSGINSLSYSEKGREILNNAIDFGENSATVHTIFGDYKVTYGEMEEARHSVTDKGQLKYSSGDSDMLLLELATEKLRADVASGEIKVKQGDYMDSFKGYLAKNSPNPDDTLKGGHGSEMIYYLSGIKGDAEKSKHGKERLLNEYMNKPDNYALINNFKENVTVKDINGNEIELHTSHAYAVKNVTEDNVTIVNPWNSSEDIVISRETYTKYSNYIESTDLTTVKKNK